MAASVRVDPLEYLPADTSAHPPGDGTGQPTPAYTNKPAPPYFPPPPASPISPESSSNPSNSIATPLTWPLSPPPDYHALDPHVRDFELRPPFIYASSSGAPQYHLKTTLTRTGRPHQLRIRRLMANESRRMLSAAAATTSLSRTTSNTELVSPLSSTPSSPSSTTTATRFPPLSQTCSTPSATSSQPPCSPILPFDDDMTIYTATLFATGALHIRGQRASCLRGYVDVSLPPPSSITSRGAGTFHHCTRNAAADALDPRNEARMRRHGYHGESEWRRVVLWRCAPRKSNGMVGRGWRIVGRREAGVGKEKECVEWRDGEGRVGAVEEGRVESGGDGSGAVAVARLSLEDGAAVADKRVRDVLVMCWVVRRWMGGQLGA